MKKTSLMKRILACSLAVISAFTIMAGTSKPVIKQEVAIATSEKSKNAKDIKSTKDKIAALEKKQKELDSQITATTDDITAEEANQKAIEEQIETVQETILTLTDSITSLETNITELETSIAQKETDIESKKAEIETGVDDFKQRIRVMYVAGNESYTDILVGATDFYDMLMKIELVKRVADHDNTMIDDLVDLKKQFEADQAALEVEKTDLETNKTELETQQAKHQEQKDKLDALYAESQATIDQLETDKETFTANKAQAQKEYEDFEANLQKLFKEQETIKQKEAEEAERKRKEEEKRQQEEDAKKQQEANNSSNNNGGSSSNNGGSSNGGDNSSSSNGGSSNGGGNSSNGNTNADNGYTDKSMFTWPVPGHYHISYGVGWRWGAYHAGIDIYTANIRGAKIVASASGTVIQVSNYCTHDYGKNGSCGCGGGYGRYCIVDHGNGWWTLYGHSEDIKVKVGDYVNQGDVLGTVGSTGYSTGPHLHFEVRKNGVALNPSNYV